MSGPTITGVTSATASSPLLIEPWRTLQEPQTVLHDIQGSASPWISVGTARTREGTLSALYGSESDADAARALLTGAELFDITYTARPSLEFTFAVVGPVEVELLKARSHWMVRWDYREVV